MKLKKIPIILVFSITLITLSSTVGLASASKWHSGIPKFLENTNWKTKSSKLNHSENGIHYSSNGVVNQAIFGKNNFKTLTTGNLRMSWNGMKKDIKLGKKEVPYTHIKYYEKSKNVYVISYVQDNDHYYEKNYLYKVGNKKFMMPTKNTLSQAYAKNLTFYKQK